MALWTVYIPVYKVQQLRATARSQQALTVSPNRRLQPYRQMDWSEVLIESGGEGQSGGMRLTHASRSAAAWRLMRALSFAHKVVKF